MSSPDSHRLQVSVPWFAAQGSRASLPEATLSENIDDMRREWCRFHSYCASVLLFGGASWKIDVSSTLGLAFELGAPLGLFLAFEPLLPFLTKHV